MSEHLSEIKSGRYHDSREERGDQEGLSVFIVDGRGWVCLVAVIDYFLKKIVGWNVSMRYRAAEWKAAKENADTDFISEIAHRCLGNGGHYPGNSNSHLDHSVIMEYTPY